MYLPGKLLVPATGFGPVMGFAFLAGYPIIAAILGTACAGCLAMFLIRKQKTTKIV